MTHTSLCDRKHRLTAGECIHGFDPRAISAGYKFDHSIIHFPIQRGCRCLLRRQMELSQSYR